MIINPTCPYCSEEMYNMKIYNGNFSTLVYLCHCNGYIESEIEEELKETIEWQRIH